MISIPLFTAMGDSDQDRVIAALHEVLHSLMGKQLAEEVVKFAAEDASGASAAAFIVPIAENTPSARAS